MEPTQILLIVVITVLTIILAIIGIQFFFILKEIKKSIQKMNRMLDDGTTVTGAFAKSISGISGVLEGVKTGLSVLNIFKRGKKKEDENEDE
ncbi:MAG: hypothetical protein M1450_03660 [Patescibacteria group bacterium]|nr:hypothetical protein [Patescibacteria group bacterium]